MTTKEEQGYRNPAYIYDEGTTGGGPDTRSSSSASSRSSMKMIGAKLKQQGRTRWLILAVVIFVAVILIIGITVAIYFARNSGEESTSLQHIDTNPHLEISTEQTTGKFSPMTTTRRDSTQQPGTSTTNKPKLTTQHGKSTTTSKTITQKSTTQKPTTQKPTTQKPTTQKPTTQKPTTQKPTTQKPTTQKPTTQKPTTQKPTTQKPTTQKPTTQQPTTQKPTTQKPTTKARTNAPTTQLPTTTSRSENSTSSDVTTQTPTSTSTNLTVGMNSILYNPNDVTSLTLRCEGLHVGSWETLTIRKQFKDSYEPIAIAVLDKDNHVEVLKLHPNISHIIDVTDQYVVLTLDLDPFDCIDLTNYTCALSNEMETVTAKAEVSIFMPEPLVNVPHSIVEDTEVTLNCMAEVWGSDGNLVWKFRPEFSTKLLDFSVEPVNNISTRNCTTLINSTLTFNITMYEDGAQFRCEIVSNWTNPNIIQSTSSDVEIRVVPSNYCDGKRLSTVHPHPYGPCTVVVFCVKSGPLVYEIECEPDHCYDYVKTACVPKGNG